MDSITPVALDALIALDPPAVPARPAAAQQPAAPGAIVAVEAPLPLAAPLALFGRLPIELPDSMQVVSPPPDWLGAALEPGSATSSDLVDRLIVYRWPPRLGGWAIGKVVAVNKDKKKKVGSHMANFITYYEVDKDNASHLLHLNGYAVSSKSKVDSWALLDTAEARHDSDSTPPLAIGYIFRTFVGTIGV